MSKNLEDILLEIDSDDFDENADNPVSSALNIHNKEKSNVDNSSLGLEPGADKSSKKETTEDKKETTEDKNETDEEKDSQGEVKIQEEDIEEKKEEKEKPEELNDIIPFDIKGTRSWNKHEPYIIKISKNKLEHDEKYIKDSFYFIAKNELKSETNSNLKTKMIKFVSNRNISIRDDYSGFIFRSIIATIEDAKEFYKVDEAHSELFSYHLGPMTVYRMLINKFITNKIGFCYRLKGKNDAVRFVPENFIKLQVLRWYEENINVLELPFDNLHNYEMVKAYVATQYELDKEKFLTKYKIINEKLGSSKSISRKELLKLKGDQWFGALNIIIYKRFFIKNIFF